MENRDVADRIRAASERAAQAAERTAAAHERAAEQHERHAGIALEIGVSLEDAHRSRELAQRLRRAAGLDRHVARRERRIGTAGGDEDERPR